MDPHTASELLVSGFDSGRENLIENKMPLHVMSIGLPIYSWGPGPAFSQIICNEIDVTFKLT